MMKKRMVITFCVWCVWRSPCNIHVVINRSVRLGVRTPPFHGGDTGSIPVQTTNVNSSK